MKKMKKTSNGYTAPQEEKDVKDRYEVVYKLFDARRSVCELTTILMATLLKDLKADYFKGLFSQVIAAS